MNRGAKIVIIAVVALFALTGIYYAFSSPKRTTASRDTDAGGTDSATGRISDPIAPGASVPQTLTMGPASGTTMGSGAVPPDAAFTRPGTAAGSMPPGSPTQSTTATTGAQGLATTGSAPASGAAGGMTQSLAPVIAPPGTTTSSTAAGSPSRILPPDRTASSMPTTPATPSINPPTTVGTPPAVSKTSPAPAATAGTTSYTIKAGDTFSTIAGDLYKDTRKWTVIAKANPGVDPSRLKVGQVIKVPTDGAVARQATTVPERASASARPTGSTHTVAKGETLAAIAERYLGSKSAWKKLYDANKDAIGSDPAKLKVGTKLVIPTA